MGSLKKIKMKIINQLFLFTILVLCSNSFAQKQNNQWRFGRFGAIDFNTVPPSFVNGCPISTIEGSASVADRITGALLFYTNGGTVWNANNQVMPNGTGLLGGDPILLSSTTAAVIVPKPGNCHLYYIFTVDEIGSNNGVRYSVVDMTLNGGLGDIVAGQKNIFLYQTGKEKLEVVPASDGLSFWLIACSINDEFVSFKIDNAGIQATPVVSAVLQNTPYPAGHMKINRQFNKIASGAYTQIVVFDFDNATGIVSNPIAWNYNSGGFAYGIEFSPDGKVLYIGDLIAILQYDLTQTTPLAIQNSVYQVTTGANIDANCSLQLGIDEKIYVNSISGRLSAINSPNNLGVACGYQTNVIANQTGGSGLGLPKWIYFADNIPIANSNSIVYSDSCFGNATQFSIQNTAGISSINWNFGDPNSGVNNTSVGFTANHTFSQVGKFNIRAILSNACGTDTLFLVALPIIDCKPPTSITGIKLMGDTCNAKESLVFSIQGTSFSPYLFWNFGDPDSGTKDTITLTGNPTITPTHTFSNPGKYKVCLTFQEPNLTVKTICRTVHIGQCCKGIIASNDSCLQNNIPFSILTGETITSVTWNFGDPTSGVNNSSSLLTPKHVFSSTGNYNIRSIVNFSCGVDTIFKAISIVNCDSILKDCRLFMPNAFTPNGDGTNNKFYPITKCETEHYEFVIYNRWGGLIFKTSNQFEKWDGKYKDTDCSSGVYIYILTYKFADQQTINLRGTFTLLR